MIALQITDNKMKSKFRAATDQENSDQAYEIETREGGLDLEHACWYFIQPKRKKYTRSKLKMDYSSSMGE